LLPIKIDFEDMIIKNIESKDFGEVCKCVNQSKESLRALGREDIFSINEIEQRYLETLVNSLEFFCGIYIDGKVIGIIKGRIETKNMNELCVLSFILMEEYRGMGQGTRLLANFENYFSCNFSIDRFCALIMENNKGAEKFWARNGYKIARVTRGVGLNAMVVLEKIRL
jgi:ribosomal protein S18 acetylase RimI-like enzyme